MKMQQRGGGHVSLYCPACQFTHAIRVTDRKDGKGWTWNGDTEKPTFHPSLLVTSGDKEYRCHSFVRDGVWEFLNDCSHEMAGQKVPMVDIPEKHIFLEA